MSRDIDVVPFRDLRVGALLDQAGRVARVVLNVATEIDLFARRIEGGNELAMDPAEVLSTGESCVVGFRGELPACVTTYLVPAHAGMTPENQLAHAAISIFGRSKARFVFAPIVAIAIADLVGGWMLGDSNLADWLEYAKPSVRMSPAQFIEGIRLAVPQPNVHAAMYEFCSKTRAGRGHLG